MVDRVMASSPAMREWFEPSVPVVPEMTWHDCPMCWRAGRILASGAWRPCGTCLGIGQVAR